MGVIRPVFVLERINHREIHLNDASLFILEDFGPLVFEPRFLRAVGMAGESVSVCFPRFHHPMKAVKRAFIPGKSSKPVIHDEVILERVAPYDRVLETSFHFRIDALRSNLPPGLQAIPAYPDTASTADHQPRAVLPPAESEVA